MSTDHSFQQHLRKESRKELKVKSRKEFDEKLQKSWEKIAKYFENSKSKTCVIKGKEEHPLHGATDTRRIDI